MAKYDPNNSESERERISYHEAGHAVVTWTFHIPLLEVYRGDKDGFMLTVESDTQLCERLEKREWYRVIGVIKCAGEFAQKRWDPNCLAKGTEDDGSAVFRFSQRLAECDGHEWSECYREELRAESKALVEANWSKIEALAIELLKRASIPGPEAEAIIDRA